MRYISIFGLVLMGLAIVGLGVAAREGVLVAPLWLKIVFAFGSLAFLGWILRSDAGRTAIGLPRKKKIAKNTGDTPFPPSHSNGDASQDRPKEDVEGHSDWQHPSAIIAERLANGDDFDLEIVARLHELPKFIAQDDDPVLWLQLVDGLNYDLPASYAVFDAMIAHPSCQNAVATGLLERLVVEDIFAQPAGEARESRPRDFALVAQICARDAAEGFPQDGCRDPDWLSRSDLKNRIEAANAKGQSDLVAPMRLLNARPTGPTPRPRFVVDEEGVSKVV